MAARAEPHSFWGRLEPESEEDLELVFRGAGEAKI